MEKKALKGYDSYETYILKHCLERKTERPTNEQKQQRNG